MDRAARVTAFDNLRGFIIVLVVLHHSALAYCRFGRFDRVHYLWSTAPIVDASKWSGFDALVLFNDSYFMPLMFLLSSLFVWPALHRKGGVAFAQDRLLRLGLPFAVTVTTIIPLAYYPSFRMTGSTEGFGQFWFDTIVNGPWPSGPAWFVAVLLGFDLLAAVSCARFARSAPAIPVRPPTPITVFAWLSVVSLLAYLPFVTLYGPTHWFATGPFSIQASRVGLYAIYFVAGIVIGRRGPGNARDLFARSRWKVWAGLAALLFGCLVTELLAKPPIPRIAEITLYRCTFVLFCATASFAWFTLFARHDGGRAGLLGGFNDNAYGVYLIHYPFVTWTQYALLDAEWNAVVKAMIVFAVALPASCAATVALRQAPHVRHVI